VCIRERERERVCVCVCQICVCVNKYIHIYTFHTHTQVAIVPVSAEHIPYANEVQAVLSQDGYYADVDDSNKTLNKKIRENQLAQVCGT
jgi:threonyl-tRNA synthetase